MGRVRGVDTGTEVAVADPTADLIEQVLRTECLTATPTTRRGYSTVLRKFLAHTGKDDGWTAADVKGYFASELEAGRSKEYLRWQYTALKPLFSSRGIAMPVPRRIVPPARPSELNAPALDPDEILAMITCAHNGELEPTDVALLAAATVWGFRRSELARIEMRPSGFVTVVTSKTGEPRIHAIPESLWPALDGYDHEMSMFEVSSRFHVIRRVARIRKTRGDGWHAMRRAVMTAIAEAGIPEFTLNAYMGWSQSARSTAARYYRPRARDVDQAVYGVHPYLAAW